MEKQEVSQNRLNSINSTSGKKIITLNISDFFIIFYCMKIIFSNREEIVYIL